MGRSDVNGPVLGLAIRRNRRIRRDAKLARLDVFPSALPDHRRRCNVSRLAAPLI